MCLFKNSSATPAIIEAEKPTETVKRTDGNVQQLRDNTKKNAASAFGVAGADKTKGALEGNNPKTKSKTLGV